MGIRYIANNSLKKRYMLKWLISNEKYNKKKKISNILKIIGVCLFIIIIGTIFMEFGFILEFIGIGCGLGFIVGCIPFIIGTSIDIKAINEYGAPFIKREKEYILISEEQIEFGFSNTNNKYEFSMDIYSIKKENISAINVDGPVLTIIGAGEFISYDDINTKRINNVNSQKKFYYNTPYSILMAFDKKDEIIESIKRMKERQGSMNE